MPQYDPTCSQSVEVPTLIALRELISRLPAWAAMCDGVGNNDCLIDRIRIGVQPGPLDGDAYSVYELEAVGCECSLLWDGQDGHIVGTDTGSPVPLQGGVFIATIHRIMNDADSETLGNCDGADIWFLDLCSAFAGQMKSYAEELDCPRLNDINRVYGPVISDWAEESAQGRYFMVQYQIYWGDGNE